MASESEGEVAIQELNGSMLNGSALNIEVSSGVSPLEERLDPTDLMDVNATLEPTVITRLIMTHILMRQASQITFIFWYCDLVITWFCVSSQHFQCY